MLRQHCLWLVNLYFCLKYTSYEIVNNSSISSFEVIKAINEIILLKL